eukprot:TRINITY_DN9781_c0_g2_i1.p1 TRINITY_DN9781_c0_g2~~TRINITY_DN9781_c0_g2_i1.p1  ORF type:complete len:750 (+),score=150.75 TRINITY_DN9781_c0_g2_i1:205-2454(+)
MEMEEEEEDEEEFHGRGASTAACQFVFPPEAGRSNIVSQDLASIASTTAAGIAYCSQRSCGEATAAGAAGDLASTTAANQLQPAQPASLATAGAAAAAAVNQLQLAQPASPTAAGAAGAAAAKQLQQPSDWECDAGGAGGVSTPAAPGSPVLGVEAPHSPTNIFGVHPLGPWSPPMSPSLQKEPRTPEQAPVSSIFGVQFSPAPSSWSRPMAPPSTPIWIPPLDIGHGEDGGSSFADFSGAAAAAAANAAASDAAYAAYCQAEHGELPAALMSSLSSLEMRVGSSSSLGGGYVDTGPGDLSDGLVLELNAGDYAHGGVWTNRVRNQPSASVPSKVRFDKAERAFIFEEGGDVIRVPLATSTWMNVSFAVWVKVLSISKCNLGWVMAQSPDYCWSRALTLSDWRLGNVSITTSCYWDSKLGQAPVGTWLHVVGVWRQGGSSTCYLNGVRGAVADGNNSRGSDPSEALMIGGRAPMDAAHNPGVAISEVRVYNRALTDEDVEALFTRGLQSFGYSAAEDEKTAQGWDPRVVEKLTAAQEEPKWDDSSQLFWQVTGVNAYDIPDGSQWQRDFREKMQSSKPKARERTLRVQVSDTCTDQPETAEQSAKRALARHSSDPERRAERAAHSSALQQMAMKPGVALLALGRKVALFRFEEQVFAVGAECPHQGGRLAEGEVGDIEDMVEGRKCYITCPVHKFKFDLATGAVMEGNCGVLPTYPVRLNKVNDTKAMVEVGFQSLAEDFFVEFGADDF